MPIGSPNRDPNARPGVARPQQGLKPPAGHTPQQPVAQSRPKSKPRS